MTKRRAPDGETSRQIFFFSFLRIDGRLCCETRRVVPLISPFCQSTRASELRSAIERCLHGEPEEARSVKVFGDLSWIGQQAERD